MVGHWCFLRLSRPVSCQVANGHWTNTHNNNRVDNERLRKLKRTRRNNVAEDGSHQWHAYGCMITAPASSRWPWFSGVASGWVVRLHPWQTSPSKCGNDVADQVSKNKVPTHQLRAGRVTTENVTRVPGSPKATHQQARATQVWQRECSAFPAGAEATQM